MMEVYFIFIYFLILLIGLIKYKNYREKQTNKQKYF